MNSVLILWSMASAASLTLAFIHLLVWMWDRRLVANALFAVVGVAVAGIAWTELRMMQAETPAEYGEWVQAFHAPLFMVIVGLVLYVRVHFGTGRRWLAWTIISLRTFVLVANFLMEPNFNFSEITAIKQMPLLGSQVAALAQAKASGWQWLATLSVVLFIGFVADASLSLWRRGGREARMKAAVVGGGMVGFVVLSILQTQMVVWRVAVMPVLMSPPFVLTLLAMAWQLSRDLLRAARTEERLSAAADEQARTEATARELQEELAHVNRVATLSELSGSLAHELNQPLGAILRNAEAAELLLKMKPPDLEELRAIVQDIRKDDQRAGAVIARMRSLLKHSRLERQPMAIESLVQDVTTLLHADATARRVTLVSEVEPGLPPVSGDRVHLSQVLLNLVVNAMDAVHGQSPDGRRVVVGARRGDGAAVEVSVADSGAGIPAALRDKVFTPFFTTKDQGMGMGLAVCRTIVEAHGGKLWVAEEAGPGAVLRLSLPVLEEVAA